MDVFVGGEKGGKTSMLFPFIRLEDDRTKNGEKYQLKSESNGPIINRK